MKIKAIQHQKTEYPSLEDFLKESDALSKKVPANWYKNKVMAGALSVFLLSGCKNDSMKSSKKANFDYIIDFIKTKINNTDEKQQVTTKVAPIFVHGDGSGAIGCVAMAFPVFISEKEARDIIFAELKKENIIFETTDCPSIEFKADPIANSCYDFGSDKSPLAEITLKLDGYNKSMNFVFEYVSEQDFDLFTSKDNCRSTAQGFYTKHAAEIIRAKLEKNGIYNAVVFYDPLEADKYEDRYIESVIDDPSSTNEEEKTGKKTEQPIKLTPSERAKNQLIAQVADFIVWAKKEGLVK